MIDSASVLYGVLVGFMSGFLLGLYFGASTFGKWLRFGSDE